MSRVLADQRRAELAALVVEHGGAVTAAQIVDCASDPASALHALFEWDDTEAAQKYREVQAQTYLRAIVRVMPREGGQEPLCVRAFVSLSDDRGTGLYRPIELVLDDDRQRAQMVADARAELLAIRAKYGHLQELTRVWGAVDVLTQSIAA